MTYIHPHAPGKAFAGISDGPVVTNMAVRENWKSTASLAALRR